MEKRKGRSYYETQEGLNYLTYLYRDRMMTDDEVAKALSEKDKSQEALLQALKTRVEGV